MNKKIIIIGGGLTGLAAGIYGRLQGYETEIFESHSLPGGVCTSWDRKGYTFDGAFHWWIGSVPETPFYRFFEQVGVFPETEVLTRELFTVIRSEDGMEFPVWADNEKLKREMLKIAPEDSDAIETLFERIKEFGKIGFPVEKPMEAYKLTDFLKMPKEKRKDLKLVRKYMNITVEEYAKAFKSNALRMILCTVLPSYCPVFTVMNFFSLFDKGDGNFPKGGALKFVLRMEKKYLGLGGKISYSARAKQILVQKNKAIGIELENGQKHYGDWILSAADGHSTIYAMLDGKYANRKIDTIYNSAQTFEPLVQVSFGINADLSEYRHAYIMAMKEKAGGADINGFAVRHYCYDDSIAPKGKSVCTVLMPTQFEMWNKAYGDKEKYKELKEEFAESALRGIETVYPKAKGNIEVTDVATPMTTVRYTSNWKGSYEGWVPNIKNLNTRVPKTLPGLKNFRMAGQWTEPGGGIPTAVMSGRGAIYMISLNDKVDWNQ